MLLGGVAMDASVCTSELMRRVAWLLVAAEVVEEDEGLT